MPAAASLETSERYQRALPLLGTQPDADLARQFGVSRESIRLWRVRNGVDRYPTKRTIAACDARLGVYNDLDVALTLGMGVAAVRHARHELGLAAARPPRPHPLADACADVLADRVPRTVRQIWEAAFALGRTGMQAHVFAIAWTQRVKNTGRFVPAGKIGNATAWTLGVADG